VSRTPLTYYGGKQLLSRQIVPLMPAHRDEPLRLRGRGRRMKPPILGAATAALAMRAWIAYVNRPKPEPFTIVYRGRDLTGVELVPRNEREKR
jgi:hypothetical protein